MSIRTNPMKAVPVLLKRVNAARTKFHELGSSESFDGKLEKLRRELNKIEDVFIKVKNNQDALLDALHEVDSHLCKLDRTRLDQDMDVICKRIRDCAHKLLPMESFDDEVSNESTQPNNQLLLPQHQPQHVNLNVLEDIQDIQLRNCLLDLSIFPVNAVIKKTQAFYSWMGKRFIWTEEVGEDVIDELLKLNVIIPYGNGKCPIFNKFILHPYIGPQLESVADLRRNAVRLGYYLKVSPRNYPIYSRHILVLGQRKVTLNDLAESRGSYYILPDSKLAIYNISTSYLNFESKWTDELKYLLVNVLQLGRWQDSPSHHIEVATQDFLNDLTKLKDLRYLSLRGISRIFELPLSIVQIKRLKILDLKACHNLETLPGDISSMESLTHLILSQCYLLDGMPRGIDKLTRLQVLKGFVLGSPRKTPCRISDLAKLKELRRLSIHIAKEAVINDGDFESLRELSKLQRFKISWGVFDPRYTDIHIILPSYLKKLHLVGFPGQRIPEWLKPSKLPRQLKELNITGGKLESMNHDEDMSNWGMQIVRLKYLKHLELDLRNLRMLFPSLRYALVKSIPNHSFTEWSID